MSWLCKVAGHSFEARYDTGPEAFKPNNSRLITEWALYEIAQKLQTKTYNCDVCTRCGMVVNRQEGK